MGRPRGRKSDPNYRQVTVYLPTELHDEARQMIAASRLRRGRSKRQDFSSLVEMLLTNYIQTAKSTAVATEESLTLQDTSQEFFQQSAAIAAMSEDEWSAYSQKQRGSKGTEGTEDAGDGEENQEGEESQEIAKLRVWASQGLITKHEFDKFVRLTTYKGTISSQEVAWMIKVRGRAARRPG